MGWGYKIDYAKAIAADEARIAWLSSEMCARIAQELLPGARLAFPDYVGWTAYQLITYRADGILGRAAAFGLTPDDIRALAFVSNEDRQDIIGVVGEPISGDYARGKTVAARCDAIDIHTESQRIAALSKAKADLARHKRNAVKDGWL